jgi:LysR family hydrogen peroxide-inducible transcriptional activator
MDEGHCLRSQAIALCRGDRRATVRHAASVETLRHLVAAGAGHSILPALAVRPDPLVDDLVSYAPLTDPQAGRIIGLAWRNTDPRVPEFTMLAQFIETVAVPRVRRIHGRRRDREG